jgi:hypothetical protein
LRYLTRVLRYLTPVSRYRGEILRPFAAISCACLQISPILP